MAKLTDVIPLNDIKSKLKKKTSVSQTITAHFSKNTKPIDDIVSQWETQVVSYLREKGLKNDMSGKHELNSFLIKHAGIIKECYKLAAFTGEDLFDLLNRNVSRKFKKV